jgi:hypothetical protein
MSIAEKEKGALALSTKLKNELPASVESSWDSNYTLTFTVNYKPILTVYYTDDPPKETDAKYLMKCVNDIINR